MIIACVNQDRGIRPGAAKGAAVHLAAMRAAFERAGAELLCVDEHEDADIRAELEPALASGQIDLVYERYALGKGLAQELAQRYGVAHTLEVNAPLLEEAARYREHQISPEERSAEQRLFAGSDLILCVSAALCRYVSDRRGSSQGVVHAPNAVGPEFLSDARRRTDFTTPGRLVIGFQGRRRPWHAFDRTVLLMTQLLERGHNVELALLGAGDFSAETGALPKDRLRRVEWVPPQEVPAYVACFDLTVLPYRSSAPAWFSPLKLAEAMSQGAVPVVSDHGDLPLLVDSDVSGRVVPADDNDALLAAVEGLLQDATTRGRLSRAARQRGRARTWDHLAAPVIALAARSRGAKIR